MRWLLEIAKSHSLITCSQSHTTPVNINSFYYDSAGGRGFYCSTLGDLYKKTLPAGSPTLLSLGGSIKCSGKAIIYNSGDDKLYFPVKDNGLYGIMSFENP